MMLGLQAFPLTLVQAGDENPIGNGFVSASNGLPMGSSDHSIWFGDIDNDTFLDVATAGYSGVNVWTGDGAGNWVSASNGLPNLINLNPAYDGGVCLGDINNDGNLDIAAAEYDYSMGGVMVWTGDGAGNWAPASTGLPGGRWYTGLHFADINNDDNLDLAIGTDNWGLRVFTGNGAGVWTDVSANLPISGKYYSVWMDDVNHDNFADLAAVGDGVHIWLGNGGASWTEVSNGLPWTDQWNGVTLGDINLDGHMDMAASMDMSGHGLRAWLGDGTSNWTSASVGLPTNGLYYGVILADMVGDKYPDMLVGGYTEKEGIEIWKGDGGISWVNESATLPTGKVIGVAAGDMNNDGHLDIGAAGEGFGVQVWMKDAINPPLSVEVETPNGGEQWTVGSQQQVNWTTSGGSPPYSMRIEYSTNGLFGQYTIVSDGEPDDGTYLWNIPSTTSFDCYVRVNVTDSASATNWDKSDYSFTIFEMTPPTISNLQPVNRSGIGNSQPVISTDYTDVTGINTSSIVLEVDSVDVTGSATVTSTDIAYNPPLALSEGVHNISLEVRDNSIHQNMARATWWFLVDSQPPSFSNERPVNQSTIGDNTPAIGVDFTDSSGVNTSTAVLEVDSVDVTSFATITFTDMWYVPAGPLPDGMHNVSVQVEDNSTPSNVGTITWWFVVDTAIPDPLPPNITNLEPANQSVIEDGTPVIGADYDDMSGINVTSVILVVDSVDVTSSAVVTPLGVTYTPAVLLTQGVHNVFLSVQDDSGNNNEAVVTWWFEVNSLPPDITNIQPVNLSLISDNRPTIGASYSDDSGIDINSIELKLDFIDVTPLATVTTSGISYIPGAFPPLLDGQHEVSLEVGDISGDQKTTKVIWSFTVDTLPPTITNITPEDGSIISDNSPPIGASFYDWSEIDTFGIMFNFVNADTGGSVAGTASIQPDGIAFTPDFLLPDGNYCIHLEVGDLAGNRATVDWCFTVDTTPPVIANQNPSNQSTVNTATPVISATFHDATGIDVSSVVLKVDSIDVAGSAMINDAGVTFTLVSGLQDGLHTVFLYVEDVSVTPNGANATWSFTISTQTVDTDYDGLPDDWETEHFGHLSNGPDEDIDGDGLTNMQEYLWKTDPTDEDTDGDGTKDGDDSNPLVAERDDVTVEAWIWFLIAIVIMAVIGILYFFFFERKEQEPQDEESDVEPFEEGQAEDESIPKE
jgi:hypothetical protein